VEDKELTKKGYRRNVAAVIVNGRGDVLACHRSDLKGVWQLPQGGVDEGECDEDALMRELEEEIGTRDICVIDKLPETIIYDWPPEYHRQDYCGQEQTYFMVTINEGAVLDLNRHHKPEFDHCQWMKVNEFLSLLSGFKTKAYEEALGLFVMRNPDVFKEEERVCSA